MGLTVLEIEVGNPAARDVTERIEFLVDYGAPEGKLALRFGHEPCFERRESQTFCT